VEIDSTTLAMILGGVELQSVRRRKRYRVPTLQPGTADPTGADRRRLNCVAATP